ncbi:MAG: hypothetical protein ABJ004_18380 [Cyclobacteriaceae bacterium]
MLKKYCLILLLSIPFTVFAQTYMDTHDPKSSDVKSLLGKENEFAGFGGLDTKLSTINDDRTLLLGMYGGVIVNRNYLLGFGGYGLASNNDFRGTYPDDPTDRKLNLHGGYGGVILGATVFTREIVHLSFPILFGGGSMDVVDEKFGDTFTNVDVTIEQSAFFVVEPHAQIEINITKKFRIAGGVSYRYVTASSFKNLEDEDLSGLTSTLSFRFGRY